MWQVEGAAASEEGKPSGASPERMAKKFSGLCRDAPKVTRGEMLRGGVIKGLLLQILPAVSQCAPPTLAWTSSAVVGSAALSRVESIESRIGMGSIAGDNHSRLAGVAAEFHRPAVRYRGISSPAIATKSLPVVPAALLMAMVGFACVSMVRDRRTWLATCPLRAGQFTFSLLPRVALHATGDGRCAERFCGSIPVLCW